MSSTATRRRLSEAWPEDRSLLLDELAAAAAEGDVDAAEDLAWAVRHFQLARAALHQHLFNEHDVEAAEQATMVAVALRIGSFRSEAKFTTWLYRVALNEAKQLVRGKSRLQADLAADPAEEYADHFIARVSSMVVDRERVQAEIADLPDDHRNALLLREETGLSYAEIAEQLVITESIAKTWVRRARVQLAERLSPSAELDD